MPRMALTIEFDGRGFAGSAVQSGVPTLQGVLRAALRDLDGAPVLTRTSGRLDAGVSASGLVAHATPRRAWPPAVLGRALNARLPATIRILRVAAVAEDWDARLEASAKTYLYRVFVRPVISALEVRSWWLRRLDRGDLLTPMADLLCGDRDLSRFSCLRKDGTDGGDPVRRIDTATWTREECWGGHAWEFRITGSGFLYRQVRGLVGAMVEVARGKAPYADFRAAVESREPATRRVGQIAPAEGLLLERVVYDPEPEWQDLDCGSHHLQRHG